MKPLVKLIKKLESIESQLRGIVINKSLILIAKDFIKDQSPRKSYYLIDEDVNYKKCVYALPSNRAVKVTLKYTSTAEIEDGSEN